MTTPRGIRNNNFPKQMPLGEPAKCWLWTKTVEKDGYARTSQGVGVKKRVHRLAWELAYGEIPEGLYVCHKCDVPRCYNPNHLFLGTQKDNMVDASSKGRRLTGNKHPLAKLDWDKVGQIRNSKLKSYVLATNYNVSVVTINKILRNETWRI